MKGSEQRNMVALGQMQAASKGLEIDLPNDAEVRAKWREGMALIEQATSMHWDKMDKLVCEDDT